MLYVKKRKPGNTGNQHKAFQIKKHPVLMLYGYYKTANNQSVYYLSTISALRIEKVNFKLQWQVLLDNFEQHLESFVLTTCDA